MCFQGTPIPSFLPSASKDLELTWPACSRTESPITRVGLGWMLFDQEINCEYWMETSCYPAVIRWGRTKGKEKKKTGRGGKGTEVGWKAGNWVKIYCQWCMIKIRIVFQWLKTFFLMKDMNSCYTMLMDYGRFFKYLLKFLLHSFVQQAKFWSEKV